MKNFESAALQTVLEKLGRLDLDPIKFKLMDAEEGEGWSREQADQIDLLYRRFLFLTVKYPQEIIVPNKAIDKFWHAHILDTRKYMDDCQDIFGEYLHHFPYLGMRSESDAELLVSSFAETKDLFLAEFGEALPGVENATQCSSACKSEGNCWSGNGCTGGKCNVKKGGEERPVLLNPTGLVSLFGNQPMMVN